MRRGSFVTGLAVLASCAGGATSAQASSIFFVHANNIWVANPDGSGTKQVTTDGTAQNPYVHVSSAKQGTSPLVGFLRFPTYGTMHPDGSGSAVISPSGFSMAGNTQGDDHEMALDAAGDRMAWSRATNIGNGETFSPNWITVDGSMNGSVSRGSTATDTTFGDTAGQTLLFDDNLPYDYRNPNNEARNWPDAPSACLAGSSAIYDLVRQAPDVGSTETAPLAYYCAAGTTDLFQPALSADGQMIAAEANETLMTTGNPNFTAGSPRIVVFPSSASASGATHTPLTFLTADGLGAAQPDFSPDGSLVAFSGPSGIYVVPTAGGSATKIIALADASSPAWSPYTLPVAGGGGGTTTGGGGTVTHPKIPQPKAKPRCHTVTRRVHGHKRKVRVCPKKKTKKKKHH